MSDGYVKVYESILQSTIWLEAPETKIVWITMLTLKDKDGVVYASIPGLANTSGVSLQACEAAINRFLSPDPYSRTKDFEGRRIREVDGGWFLINHAKYRDLRTQKNINDAERKRKSREKDVTTCHNMSHDVTHRHGVSGDGDGDGDGSVSSLKEEIKPPKRNKKPRPDFGSIVSLWRERCVPCGLPDVLAVEKTRKARLEVCAGDTNWMEMLPEAIDALLADSWNLGDNPRKWKANIDYLLQGGKAAVLVEKYRASHNKPAASSTHQGVDSGMSRAMDDEAQRLREIMNARNDAAGTQLF